MSTAGPLGFACAWEHPRAATWSGTPLGLYEALARRTALADLGPDPSPAARRALKVAFARRRQGRWVTTWKWSAAWQVAGERVVRRRARARGCRAVVQVQDLAAIDVPYYVWQDLSIAALLEVAGEGDLPGGFEAVSPARLAGRRVRQERVYARARGLLPMSRWLAGRLVAAGTPAERVHVLHPGSNVAGPEGWPALPDAPPAGPGRRLLFVGRDFARKGGDAVLGAFSALRQRRPALELTVIGPRRWPVAGSVPPGVNFLGAQPARAVVEAMSAHDGFVMPSRFEAFGIAPAEALCCGLPSLVRDAYAMPEVVTDGRDGVVVASLEREELVAGMERLLEPELRARCLVSAPGARAYWSWDRAAGELLGVLERDGLGAAA